MTLTLTIQIPITAGEPCGCGDATHQARYYAESLEAIQRATSSFWQCEVGKPELRASFADEQREEFRAAFNNRTHE